jgi:hypothetical protein
MADHPLQAGLTIPQANCTAKILPIGVNWTIIRGVQVQIAIPLEKMEPMRASQHGNEGLTSLWIVSWLLIKGREESK